MAQRDWYLIAERPTPAPHLACPEGCAALGIVLVAVPRVSRSCEHFPDGFELHLLDLSCSNYRRSRRSCRGVDPFFDAHPQPFVVLVRNVLAAVGSGCQDSEW